MWENSRIRVELNDISNEIVIVPSGRIVNAAASLRPGQLSDMLIAFVVFDLAFTGDKVDFVNWLRNSIPLGQAMRLSHCTGGANTRDRKRQDRWCCFDPTAYT